MSRRFAQELTKSLSHFVDWEILFYDNSPTRELSDLTKFGSYYFDERNLGFSFANNQLILSGNYPNIALINPDVFGFDMGFWKQIAARVLGRNEVRFVKLLNQDGSHQDCVGEVASLSRAWRRGVNYASITEERPVGMGIMAFMITTREVVARVGLLDCDYPLYAEDMDWSYRAGAADVPIIYDPTLTLTHLGGASAGDRWSQRESMRRKYDAERIFINKHARGGRRLAMLALNRLKIFLRA